MVLTLVAKNAILKGMRYPSTYIAPTLTVDAVVFRLGEGGLEVLLSRRANEPFLDAWALPGGYVTAGQTTLEALTQKLQTKTGVNIDRDTTYIEQLYAFDTVARDPRGHAVSVVYVACGRDITPVDGSQESRFFSLDKLPQLAYDHRDIVIYARAYLADKLAYSNAIYSLLDRRFTLTQLQAAYEAVLGRTLDKRNFRKKILSLGFVHDTLEIYQGGAHRPAKLYEFNSQSYEALPSQF